MVELARNKANSALFKLQLRLSLAKDLYQVVLGYNSPNHRKVEFKGSFKPVLT